MDDPQDLLALARDLAAQAARLQLDRLDLDRTAVETKSSATDMVTEVDRACERQIVDGILASRPGDGVLGEEGADVAGTSGRRWVIDPIDGTTNYLYGHPGFAVSIAVEDENGALAGVVHDPLHGDVFEATRGGGATRNGLPIAVSQVADPALALVATGFGFEAEHRRAQGEVLGRLIGDIRDIRRMGAAAVDLCSVASGRVDAFFERGLSPWDFAAGALIAAEAGARVGSIEGGEIRPGSVLAASPALFDPLRDLLAAAGAVD